MRAAAWLIKISAWVVPADQRRDWRREWLAELRCQAEGRASARPDTGRLKPAPPTIFAFALGAPWHALWLRKDAWRPALVAADIKFGVRQLRRRPGLATAAILTLALGTGATTAIFSVVYGVLLKPLPYRDPAGLVQLWEVNPLFHWTEAAIAPGNLLSWRERNHSFSDIAFYFGSGSRQGFVRNLTLNGDEPARVQGSLVSINFFDVLGAAPAQGRTFLPGEDIVGRHHVLVLSDQFWKTYLGRDPHVIGRTVTLNGIGFTVAGVMRPDFQFDVVQPDFWMPLTINLADQREVRRPHQMRAIARLKPGVTMTQARADLADIAHDLEREYPATNKEMGVGLGPLDDWFVGQTRRPLVVFLAAVGLVLLIACVNVANLMFARSLERTGEMSIRAALGASRARLVRQLLAESLVIATLGSALGLALAAFAVQAFIRFAPVNIPRLGDVALDPIVFLFCLGLTATITVLIGLAPAAWGARSSLRNAIGSGTRATTGRAPALRRMLVAAEVALAVVLVVGATLTLRSFGALLRVDPGLPIGEEVTARVSLPAAGYGDDGESAAFFEDASARLRALPGVISAGAVAQLPLEGASWTSQSFIDGRPEFHGYEVRHKAATSGYLEALGVRTIAGRTLAPEDRPSAPLAVVVNATLARQYFPGDTAVGHRLAWDTPGPKTAWRTIVGVVSDEPQDGIGAPAVPEVYYPLLQEERSEMALVVRSTWPADRAMSEMRRVVRAIDPQLALFDVATMSSRVEGSLAKPRVAAWLVGGFASVALLLAMIGIYGVTAWAANARSREFGIRVACGAARSDVYRLVMRQDLAVVVAGMVIGVGLAGLAARAAGSLLFGVTPADWVSYAVGLILLFIAGVAACSGPARRASRVDAVTIMRADG